MKAFSQESITDKYKVRNAGVGIILWVVAIPIFLFVLFPLASCTTDKLSGIYLMEFQWITETGKKLWFRVGYYGTI